MSNFYDFNKNFHCLVVMEQEHHLVATLSFGNTWNCGRFLQGTVKNSGRVNALFHGVYTLSPEYSSRYVNNYGSYEFAECFFYDSREKLEQDSERLLASDKFYTGVIFLFTKEGEWVVYDENDPNTWDYLPLKDVLCDHAEELEKPVVEPYVNAFAHS